MKQSGEDLQKKQEQLREEQKKIEERLREASNAQENNND